MKPAYRDLHLQRGCTFGPYVWHCRDKARQPVDLTGWTVEAHARTKIGGDLVFDLLPTITDAEGGEVTITFQDEETLVMTLGTFVWDLVFTTPTGERMPPLVAGKMFVTDIVTQPS